MRKRYNILADGGMAQQFFVITFGFEGDEGYVTAKSKPILAPDEDEAAIKLIDQFEMNEGVRPDIISIKKMAKGGMMADGVYVPFLKQKFAKKIKNYYTETFPNDKEGKHINPKATFGGLHKALANDINVYEYIGVGDSIIRERVFQKLADILNVNYDVIYDAWSISEDLPYDENEFAEGGMMAKGGMMAEGGEMDFMSEEFESKVKDIFAKPKSTPKKLPATKRTKNAFGLLSFEQLSEIFNVELFGLNERETEKMLEELRDEWNDMSENDRITLLNENGIKYADGGMMAKGGETVPRYRVDIYEVGNEYDKQYSKYANTLDEAKILAERGNQADIYDNEEEKYVEYAHGGMMAKGGKVKRKRWIQDAINPEHKGMLRATAKRKHLIEGDEKLSMADLHKLEKMGGKTAQRAHLAETLRSFKSGGITPVDMLEARQFFGDAEWSKLSRKDKINSAKYLKRTGKIGYKKGGKLPEPPMESQEFYAAMQYKKGGKA